MYNLNIPETESVAISQFSINDYIGWFEKIDINTLSWQIIVLIFIFIFMKDIKKLITGFVDKLPQMTRFGGAEFGLSEETETRIEESKDKIEKEIEKETSETYVNEDANMVFLARFIELERGIRKTHLFINPKKNRLPTPSLMIRSLVRDDILGLDAYDIYQEIEKIRRRIIRGEPVLRNPENAKKYSEAIFLLRHMLGKAFSKASKAKEKKERNEV